MQNQNNYYHFDCGCRFEVFDEGVKECDGLPSIEIDYENIPRDCQVTWDIYHNGRTKGVFQLENALGQHWAKETVASSIEDAAALISIIRPGCISGDTKILVSQKLSGGRIRRAYVSMSELYRSRYNSKYQQIISYNEKEGTFFHNRVEDVIYTGKKEVFSVHVEKYLRNPQRWESDFFDLICTDDHKILTPTGYIKLQDLKIGDRVALNKCKRYSTRSSNNGVIGKGYFQEICFQNYEYKCVFCDWKDGSLDCNHLIGNRETDNSPENLCFLCPNHHRMYSEGTITSHDVVTNREKYVLPATNDITWGRYVGKQSLGIQEVYDITMKGPHHNFVAGNVVVHNCLRSKIDDVSMTQLYADRKRGAHIDSNKIIKAIQPILSNTFFILCYQEQSMRIAMDIAGYSEEEADILRKAIGKKDAKLMASLRSSFLQGCKKMGLVTEEEAAEIFGWIRESQRYSFNKSHGAGYGDLGYWTAYAKAHFPLHFFASWLNYAPEKMKPKWEVRDLLFDCQLFEIPVYPPSILEIYGGNTSFQEGRIRLGLKHVSGVGYKAIQKLAKTVQQIEIDIDKHVSEWTWYDFLIYCSNEVSTTVVNNMISIGALDHMGLSRAQMTHEYNVWGPKSGNKPKLTKVEKTFLRENRENYPNLLAGLEHLCYTNHNDKRISTKDRVETVDGYLEQLKNPAFSMNDDPTLISKREHKLIGKSISIHNTETCTIATNTTCREFNDGKNANFMTLVAEVGFVKEYPGKGKNKGRTMSAMSLEDKTGRINAMCFYDQYEEFGEEFIVGNLVTVKIKRSQDGKAIIEKVF